MAKLADLFIRLGLKKDGFDKGLDDSKKKTNSFGNTIKKVGGYIAGAFAVQQLISFGSELIKLSGEAKGVEDAFNRIADRNVLKNLKEATSGTVSELELMKRAVSAQNLGLPVENLASLFEFATKRAQDTGESVDYLVNSIVTGIGRKSPLILDNLGISAIQLREKLKGVGMESASVAEIAAAVGEIAVDSMRDSGKVIETTAIQIQQMNANWQDTKVQIGNAITQAEWFKKTMSELSKTAVILSSDLSFWQKINPFESQEKTYQKALKANEEADKAQVKLNKDTEEFKNLLPEITLNAEEYNKKLEEQRKIAFEAWEKQNKESVKQLEILNSLISSQEKLNNLSSEYFVKPTADVSGIVGGRGVFDMFDGEVIEELPIDTEKIVAQLNYVTDSVSAASDMIKQVLATMVTDISSALGEAFASGNWQDFGKAILEIVGGFLQQLGALMIAYAVNMALFSASLANPLAWPVALAAGIALVAIGSAISSLGKAGLSGSASSSASGYSASGSSASTAISGNVSFVLEGDKLVGAINNNSAKRRLTR